MNCVALNPLGDNTRSYNWVMARLARRTAVHAHESWGKFLPAMLVGHEEFTRGLGSASVMKWLPIIAAPALLSHRFLCVPLQRFF